MAQNQRNKTENQHHMIFQSAGKINKITNAKANQTQRTCARTTNNLRRKW